MYEVHMHLERQSQPGPSPNRQGSSPDFTSRHERSAAFESPRKFWYIRRVFSVRSPTLQHSCIVCLYLGRQSLVMYPPPQAVTLDLRALSGIFG